MKKMMSVKSVVFSLFLIVCFSTYSLCRPYDHHSEPSSPKQTHEEDIHHQEQQQSSDHKQHADVSSDVKEGKGEEESCGIVCKAGKSKDKIVNATKSVVSGVKEKFDEIKDKIEDAAEHKITSVKEKIGGVKKTVKEALGLDEADTKYDPKSVPVVEPGTIYDVVPSKKTDKSESKSESIPVEHHHTGYDQKVETAAATVVEKDKHFDKSEIFDDKSKTSVVAHEQEKSKSVSGKFETVLSDNKDKYHDKIDKSISAGKVEYSLDKDKKSSDKKEFTPDDKSSKVAGGQKDLSDGKTKQLQDAVDKLFSQGSTFTPDQGGINTGYNNNNNNYGSRSRY